MKFYTLPSDYASVAELVDARSALMKASPGQGLVTDTFMVSFIHLPDYLPHPEPLHLLCVVSIQKNNGILSVYFGLLPADATHIKNLEGANPDTGRLKQYFADHQTPWLNLSAPLLLEPVYIPKPWGQEIWFTGIEARGQSRVSDGFFSVPLPWVLELLPRKESLTLLKILDPLPHENLGNLYFELHEQKQEVYVVTDVDLQAWPDGVGQIQMGFCQEKRKQYSSDTEFKQAYLQVVSEYKKVRQKIDQALDESGGDDNADRVGLYLQFAASPDNCLLVEQEKKWRQDMKEFIYHHPLKKGDVVKVPCRVPHSLQHGVRVVEFQTPVYERKILSFGQKVLTQADWDTEEAMTLALTDVAQWEEPELLSPPSDYRLERIVHFDDFQVQRLTVARTCKIPLNIRVNTLMMLIQGAALFTSVVQEDERGIEPGQAYWMTSEMSPHDLMVESGSIVLVAMPNNPTNWCN